MYYLSPAVRLTCIHSVVHQFNALTKAFATVDLEYILPTIPDPSSTENDYNVLEPITIGRRN